LPESDRCGERSNLSDHVKTQGLNRLRPEPSRGKQISGKLFAILVSEIKNGINSN